MISAGHAFIQNVHRGHYALGVDVGPTNRLAAVFTELILASLEDYSKPHVIEKKNSPRAASYASR